MDKLKELSLGEKVLSGGGVLLLVFSFFTWFSKSQSGFTYDGHNGWGGFVGLLGILLAIATVVVVLLPKFSEVKLPDKLGNFGWDMVIMVAGIVAFVLVLLQVLAFGQSVSGVSLDATIWAYLGLIASAAVGAGAFLTSQDMKKAGGSTPPPAA